MAVNDLYIPSRSRNRSPETDQFVASVVYGRYDLHTKRVSFRLEDYFEGVEISKCWYQCTDSENYAIICKKLERSVYWELTYNKDSREIIGMRPVQMRDCCVLC